jgi:hypothetical protein
LISVNRQYLNSESFQANPSRQYFAETPAEKEIAQDPDYFRVLSLTEGLTQGARTSYRFYSLGGYHGAKLRRYQDLIDYQLQSEIQDFVSKAQEGNFDWQGISVINMMNTKYLIAGQDANSVFENPAANGAAWIPSEIVPVQSNEEEITEIGEINTKTQATVNTEEFGDISSGSGNVTLTDQSPNELHYSVNMENAGLVVFSEIHYPKGWKATIDGAEQDILRVNYLLRGLEVPAGSHEVTFTFEPSSYYATKTPMIIFQYLILASLLAGIFITYKQENEPRG